MKMEHVASATQKKGGGDSRLGKISWDQAGAERMRETRPGDTIGDGLNEGPFGVVGGI